MIRKRQRTTVTLLSICNTFENSLLRYKPSVYAGLSDFVTHSTYKKYFIENKRVLYPLLYPAADHRKKSKKNKVLYSKLCVTCVTK